MAEVIYDYLGWPGIVWYHVAMQTGQLLLYATEPAVWESYSCYAHVVQCKCFWSLECGSHVTELSRLALLGFLGEFREKVSCPCRCRRRSEKVLWAPP